MEIESHRAFVRAFHAADDNDQKAIVAAIGRTQLIEKIDEIIVILWKNLEIYENKIEEYSERIEETQYEIEDLAEDLTDQRTSKVQQEFEKKQRKTKKHD